MKAQLPPKARAQLEKVLQKLLDILSQSHEHTSARSEFMNIDGSTGGQVLESSPQIEHPYHELSDLYLKLLADAKDEGLDIREIETVFRRASPGSQWSFETRWLTNNEFDAFTERVAPLLPELELTLRRVAQETAADWYSASFVLGRKPAHVIILHGKRVRIVLEPPPPDLLDLASRFTAAARDDGLELIGANWEVSADEDDGLESAIGINHAWSTGA